MRVVWRRRALADLRALREFIARNNPSAAARTAARVHQAVARLAAFPHQGRAGRDPSTRELIVTGTPYLVIYHVHQGTVEVLRVLHGRQQWP